MHHTTSPIRRSLALVSLGMLSMGALVACGDDDEKASVTHDEFIAAACEQLKGVDPGFEQFFADHPEPTLADWVEFLPRVESEFDEMIAVGDLPRPGGEEDTIQAAVDAMVAAKANFTVALEAAKAGDEDAFHASEELTGGLVEKMEAAMADVDDSECPGTEE